MPFDILTHRRYDHSLICAIVNNMQRMISYVSTVIVYSGICQRNFLIVDTVPMTDWRYKRDLGHTDAAIDGITPSLCFLVQFYMLPIYIYTCYIFISFRNSPCLYDFHKAKAHTMLSMPLNS